MLRRPVRSKNPTAIETLQLTNPWCDDQEVGSVTTATRETSRFSRGAMAGLFDHPRSESKNLEDVGIVRRRFQSWSRRLAREKIHALYMDSGFESYQTHALSTCQHYTKPTHTSHAGTRHFSRVAQDLSHRVRIHSVSHKTVNLHIKHNMSHAPSLLYPSQFSTTSFSICTPSSPSFYSNIYQTFTDVIFTRGLSLRRCIECVFRSYG